jgi:hypothetical protein
MFGDADQRAQGTPDKLVFSLSIEPTYCAKVFGRLSCTISLELIEERALITAIRKNSIRCLIGKFRYEVANKCTVSFLCTCFVPAYDIQVFRVV